MAPIEFAIDQFAPLSCNGGKGGKKEAILLATLKVMSEKGFHETTIDEIAEKAGVGKGTIYSYFPSKTALVEELIESASAMHFARAKRSIADAANGKEQLLMLIEYELKFIKKNTEIAIYLNQNKDFGTTPEFREKISQSDERYLRLIADIVERGQREQLFDAAIDPDIAASMIVGLGLHVLRRRILKEMNLPLQDIKEQVVHFILKGLA